MYADAAYALILYAAAIYTAVDVYTRVRYQLQIKTIRTERFPLLFNNRLRFSFRRTFSITFSVRSVVNNIVYHITGLVTLFQLRF